MGIKSVRITASSLWHVEDGGRIILKLDAAAVGASPSLGKTLDRRAATRLLEQGPYYNGRLGLLEQFWYLHEQIHP
jgi:hypothetical protein